MRSGSIQDDRKKLLNQLYRKFGYWNETMLMDALQDRGLVADEAVLLADCADRDLIKALQKS